MGSIISWMDGTNRKRETQEDRKTGQFSPLMLAGEEMETYCWKWRCDQTAIK